MEKLFLQCYLFIYAMVVMWVVDKVSLSGGVCFAAGLLENLRPVGLTCRTSGVVPRQGALPSTRNVRCQPPAVDLHRRPPAEARRPRNRRSRGADAVVSHSGV